MENDIDARVDRIAHELRELAGAIHADPELSWNEHRAVGRIAELLTRHGANVERSLAGIPTAFRAKAGDGGARVAILAEYDALPEIGHACGHNLIAAGAVGAWLAIAPEAEALGGTVELIGTPAEESGGGKIRLLAAGVFEGVDAALMYHPFDRDLLMHPTLAIARLDVVFDGTPSHAAAAPHEGRSALTACMDAFRLIDSQRLHLPEGSRVHGIITDGGQAVNIIPERAACQIAVRGRNRTELARVQAVAERCLRAAAMASDVDVHIDVRMGYRDMQNNEPLARRFGDHLRALGRDPVDRDPDVGTGSTDMGDVSWHVPAIHPWLAICGRGETMCHQRAFLARAASPGGMDTMLVAAKAMARTVRDLLTDRALRDTVAGQFVRA